MTDNRRQVAYTLPSALVDDIKSISKDTAIPMSRLVEKALTAYINEHYPPDPSGGNEPRVTQIAIAPEMYQTMLEIEKDKAGYPLFKKDVKPWHTASPTTTQQPTAAQRGVKA